MEKLNWFFCLNENRQGAFLDMAKVAVLSSLEYEMNRYCVYDGNNKEFIEFLENHGVQVIIHESSFKDKIKEYRREYLKSKESVKKIRTDEDRKKRERRTERDE